MVRDGTEQAEGGPKPGDEDALDALRHHWGEAYDITAEGGLWRAMRLDELGGPIEGADPDELGRLIIADYDMRPVPRGRM
jgi:hypothetical protein